MRNDEYVFGTPVRVRDGPEENKVKSTVKKVIKEAINTNQPFKDFLETNHLYGKYVSSAVKCCTETKDYFRKNPIDIAYIITCRKDIHRIINETIYWGKTSQGSNFWNNVYNMAEEQERNKNKTF